MKAKIFFKQRTKKPKGPLQDFLAGSVEKTGPFLFSKNDRLNEAVILVEVEGGVVQNVSLLSQSGQPVLVLVRDYDNYKAEPDDYQDAEWLLV